MPVPVVGVGDVGVRMLQRCMPMLVAVLALWHGIMRMVVMPVVVAMGMLVFE